MPKTKKMTISLVIVLLFGVSFSLGFFSHALYWAKQFPIWVSIATDAVVAEKEEVVLNILACQPTHDESGHDVVFISVERDEKVVYMNDNVNCCIVYASQPEGPWHIVYQSSFAVQTAVFPRPGPVAFEFTVPGNSFVRKGGCYRFGLLPDELYVDIANPYC